MGAATAMQKILTHSDWRGLKTEKNKAEKKNKKEQKQPPLIQKEPEKSLEEK